MHFRRQPYVLCCRHGDTDERAIQERILQSREIFRLPIHRRRMQGRIGVAVDNGSNLAPLCLDMLVRNPRHGATAEAIETLVPSKRLVASVVNEDQEIVGVGLQFFICSWLHRRRIADVRAQSKAKITAP